MARRSGDEVAVFISEGAFSETELLAGILMLIGPEKVVNNLRASVEKIQYSTWMRIWPPAQGVSTATRAKNPTQPQIWVKIKRAHM